MQIIPIHDSAVSHPQTFPGMDEALVAYRRSIAADPQERDAQPLYHAGQILMYRGQYEEAEVGRFIVKSYEGAVLLLGVYGRHRGDMI